MKKRLLILTTFIILNTCIFTSCDTDIGKKNETVNKTAGSETLQLNGTLKVATNIEEYGGSQENLGVYEYFKTNYPKLVIKEVDWKGQGDIDRNLATAIESGKAPDVIFGVSPEAAADMIKNGIAEDLTSRLNSDPTFKDSFLSNTLEAYQYAGKQWAIPREFLPQANFVNTDLFSAAGITVPSDWNIDEYIDISKKMTDHSKGITGNYVDINDGGVLFQFLKAYGVKGYKIVDGKGSANLEEDKNAHIAINKFIELTSKGGIQLTAKEKTQFHLYDWWIPWGGGYAAMVPNWSLWAYPIDANTNKLNFRTTVLPAPKGPNGDRGIMSMGKGLMIYSGSTDKDLAWEYIKVLSSKDFNENAVSITRQGRKYPFVPHSNMTELPIGIIATKADYEANAEAKAVYEGFKASLNHQVIDDMGGATQSGYIQKLIFYISKVATGEMLLDDALKQFDNDMNTRVYAK